jgi:NAD(P)-dependent dehydrogenase (short-subunit alcohol dehydrogenase family)
VAGNNRTADFTGTAIGLACSVVLSRAIAKLRDHSSPDLRKISKIVADRGPQLVESFLSLGDLTGHMANAKKVALITGGNKGLGLEMARQLGKAGVTVVLAARDPQRGEAAAELLRKEGVDVQFVKLDVKNREDHAPVVKFLEQNFGRLDILINNAGISLEEFGAGWPSRTTDEVIQQTFDVNFFAPVALTRALLPLLKQSDAGRIVNMSSILGSLTLHSDPNSPIYNFKSLSYDSSKAALNSFTIHLAYELKDTKIKVNSAHPGWVKTDMGTDAAPMEIPEGGKTGVELALLGEDGPNGGYFHLGKPLPW